MKYTFLFLFLPCLLSAQNRSMGLLSTGKAHGAFFSLHHQATDLWSVSLSAEGMKGRTTTAALVMVNGFTAGKALLTFSIGHTVYPSHGAFVEGGMGTTIGPLAVGIGYRHAAAMPRTEEGTRIMESGLVARVGVGW